MYAFAQDEIVGPSVGGVRVDTARAFHREVTDGRGVASGQAKVLGHVRVHLCVMYVCVPMSRKGQ